LTKKDGCSVGELQAEINDARLSEVLAELAAEGLIVQVEHTYMLPRI
jgi:DNA-binding HxlR family transcriptional regulator